MSFSDLGIWLGDVSTALGAVLATVRLEIVCPSPLKVPVKA